MAWPFATQGLGNTLPAPDNREYQPQYPDGIDEQYEFRPYCGLRERQVTINMAESEMGSSWENLPEEGLPAIAGGDLPSGMSTPTKRSASGGGDARSPKSPRSQGAEAAVAVPAPPIETIPVGTSWAVPPHVREAYY